MPSLGHDKMMRKEARKNARKAKNQSHMPSYTKHLVKQINNWFFTKAVKPEQQMSSRHGNSRFNKRKRPRTKFEEYLDLEQKRTAQTSAEEDLALERRLGKKLKMKHGVFPEKSDGLSDLLQGMVSSDILEEKNKHKHLESETPWDHVGTPDDDEASDALTESGSDDGSVDEGVLENDSELDDSTDAGEDDEGKQLDVDDDPKQLHLEEAGRELHQHTEGEPYDARKVRQAEAVSDAEKLNAEEPSLTKYVAPHRRVNDALSNELLQIQRRTRGLLNRLSEDNVESIAPEILSLFQVYGRRVMTDTITKEILGAVCTGPRGNEQYAAVFAAFIAGVASSVGMDFGANFVACYAENLEEQRKREDSLAVRNMVLLLSYLFIFKMISCDVIYDLLYILSKTLIELDVSMILTFLQTCGMGLRADDPVAMKDFVLSVQHRYEELKAAAVKSESIFHNGKRMQFMLETICEIKDNRRRVKQEKVPHARLKKWLQKLGIEEVQLRALKWKKLLDPDKRGQWWISGGNVDQGETHNAEVTDFIHKETAEAEKMLQLAATQKMNTDIRRAIFCVVMSGEDYVDAFEKILRIKLTGKQDREIIRVIIECCLQEKMFNKYYSLLISKLCHHDKNHKFTLQYCFWDHFKQLSSMEMRRLANLAYLLADIIAKFSLSLSVLKVVDFSDTQTMTPRAVLFFCIFLRVLLTGYGEEVVSGVFSRIASAQELEGLRLKLSVFCHQQLMKDVGTKGSQESRTEEDALLLRRFNLVKKTLTTSSGL